MPAFVQPVMMSETRESNQVDSNISVSFEKNTQEKAKSVLINGMLDTEESPQSETGNDDSLDKSTEATKLAPADHLWATIAEGAVQLRMERNGPNSEPPELVHEMLLKSVQLYGDLPALKWKEGNDWTSLTFTDYYQLARSVAKSFLKLGLERFHGVGILGFNSPRWFVSDIGAIMAGGFAVGIYTTNSPEACQYVAENCKANIIVVENDKQLQKIIQVWPQLPHLKAIVQYSGELKDNVENVYLWSDFIEMGKDVDDSRLDKVMASQKANQCCTLIYTSGTTGEPKGVMLSHDNITWTARRLMQVLKIGSAHEMQQQSISYLPLSHIAAQMCDIWLCAMLGATTNFASPDALKGTLVNTMKEVRPTVFFGVPRVWEKIMEKIKVANASSGFLKRSLVSWGQKVGLEANIAAMKGESPPWSYGLAHSLIFKNIRQALGLDRCNICYVGAAPIAPETLEYFLSFDIPIYELYGMSESTGPQNMNVKDSHRIGSCGRPIPGFSLKLSNPDEEQNGEVCFWGRHVFMGYLSMEENTRNTLDEEGWLHSGDLGNIDDDGFLTITGRIKELIITAGGENIPPLLIEHSVKTELPFISNAMLIGDKRKFLSILLTLKCQVNESTGEPQDELSDDVVAFFRKIGSNSTRVSEVLSSSDPVVNCAIAEGIERVNQKATSNAQRVQKWDVLPQDFSIVGGELGPTLKLKRPAVLKKNCDRINNLYCDLTPTSSS
uniref:long-chain-fatty-acid--CoA ligase n=1 Tax=Eptatretus burgeri TaxID=7764 RepID=A0A8C4NB18_EPTBU